MSGIVTRLRSAAGKRPAAAAALPGRKDKKRQTLSVGVKEMKRIAVKATGASRETAFGMHLIAICEAVDTVDSEGNTIPGLGARDIYELVTGYLINPLDQFVGTLNHWGVMYTIGTEVQATPLRFSESGKRRKFLMCYRHVESDCGQKQLSMGRRTSLTYEFTAKYGYPTKPKTERQKQKARLVCDNLGAGPNGYSLSVSTQPSPPVIDEPYYKITRRQTGSGCVCCSVVQKYSVTLAMGCQTITAHCREHGCNQVNTARCAGRIGVTEHDDTCTMNAIGGLHRNWDGESEESEWDGTDGETPPEESAADSTDGDTPNSSESD